MGRHRLIKAPLIEWPMSAIGLAGLAAKPPIDRSDLWAPMHPSVNLCDTRKANRSYRGHQHSHTHTHTRARVLDASVVQFGCKWGDYPLHPSFSSPIPLMLCSTIKNGKPVRTATCCIRKVLIISQREAMTDAPGALQNVMLNDMQIDETSFFYRSLHWQISTQ